MAAEWKRLFLSALEIVNATIVTQQPPDKGTDPPDRPPCPTRSDASESAAMLGRIPLQIAFCFFTLFAIQHVEFLDRLSMNPYYFQKNFAPESNYAPQSVLYSVEVCFFTGLFIYLFNLDSESNWPPNQLILSFIFSRFPDESGFPFQVPLPR